LPAAGAGAFRSDLFYRIKCLSLALPPCARPEDIHCVEYFLDAARSGQKMQGFNKKTLELLQAYRWPGNIRELQNVMSAP